MLPTRSGATGLVNNVALAVPDVTRVNTFPRSANGASSNRLTQPTCERVCISQLWITLARVRSRLRRTCEGRESLMLTAPDVSGGPRDAEDQYLVAAHTEPAERAGAVEERA
jgi:hypothetical protein